MNTVHISSLLVGWYLDDRVSFQFDSMTFSCKRDCSQTTLTLNNKNNNSNNNSYYINNNNNNNNLL